YSAGSSPGARGGVWRTYVTEPSTETGRPGHWGMTPSSGGRCASGSSTARFIRPILLPQERLQPPVDRRECGPRHSLPSITRDDRGSGVLFRVRAPDEQEHHDGDLDTAERHNRHVLDEAPGPRGSGPSVHQ